MDKIKNILWIIPVLFVWTWVVVAPASAQPELKAGQEVEIYYDGKFINRCLMDGTQLIICSNDKDISPISLITKPAPRPEFKLPIGWAWCQAEYHRAHPQVYTYKELASADCVLMRNDEAITDELRYLRKEVEALRK